MKRLRAVVVGAGERVVNDVLPALASLPDLYEVAGVFTRSPRAISAAGREWEARGLEDLERTGLADVDLVYLVVRKDAVPGVLARLARLGPAHAQLQLETPGLLYKHLSHRPLLDAWRATWVSEDTTTLPIWDPVDDLVRTGRLGRVERVLLDRCGYAYHGVAMARRLLGGGRVLRASRRTSGAGEDRREFVLRGGGRATVLGPRRYAAGSFEVAGTSATVGDRDGVDLRLSPVLDGERCTGFVAGDSLATLTAPESELLGPWGSERPEHVGSRMHGLKRVGLRRLLARVARGEGGYPLEQGLEDMAVDYHLEKLGRYLRNPLTRGDSAWPGRLLRLLGR